MTRLGFGAALLAALWLWTPAWVHCREPWPPPRWRSCPASGPLRRGRRAQRAAMLVCAMAGAGEGDWNLDVAGRERRCGSLIQAW